MADVSEDFDDPAGAYYAEEEALEEHILRSQGRDDEEFDIDLFRPALADEHMVGFFGGDRATQTEETEIVEIKEMTEVLQVLIQEVNTLKRDLDFNKQAMQSDYDNKVQTKAFELYARINEKSTEIGRQHQDRVDTLRRAYRQQLADAMSRITNMYDKNMQSSMHRAKTQTNKKEQKLEAKLKEQLAVNKRYEATIAMLKQQVAELKENANDDVKIVDLRESPPPNKAATPPPPPRQTVQNVIQGVDPKEMDQAQAELTSMRRRVLSLQDALQTKEESYTVITDELKEANAALSNERVTVETLTAEKNELQMLMDQERMSTKRLADAQEMMKQEMGDQKARLQQEMDAAVRTTQAQAEEQMFAKQSQLSTDSKATESKKNRALLDQKKMYEDMLARERAKQVPKSGAEADLERVKASEERLKLQVNKLKREIDRINKMWEKKFAILQQSLHALKDEMFLRQTLQKQAATLHHAAVSYATDAPTQGVTKGKAGKKPLPDIRKASSKADKEAKDYISYTISAPSGRQTAFSADAKYELEDVFEMDEHQVMSESEDEIPKGVIAFPSPPRRVQFACPKGNPNRR